jgi:RNA polymerase sigma factor (sigma-70 family)
VSGRHDDEFTEFVSARLGILRRVAYLLCQDWQRSDDLVQAAVTRLYVHWERARGLEHIEACAKTILVREFLGEQRSSWAKRVRIGFALPDSAALAHDSDAELDMRAALAGLAPRQRATIVLRFYCDLSVEQTAELLGCTESSQAARPDRRSHCMDEREVRDMLHKIASDEAPPSRVSIGLALSKGLRRRRTGASTGPPARRLPPPRSP